MTSPRFWTNGLFLMVGLALITVADGAAVQSGGSDASADRAASAIHIETTFYADVMPVLMENCVDCHQPQGFWRDPLKRDQCEC